MISAAIKEFEDSVLSGIEKTLQKTLGIKKSFLSRLAKKNFGIKRIKGKKARF